MQTINSLFAGAVEHYADSPALIEPVEGSGMSTLTYRELQGRSHAFAGYLQAQQLEKGNCILIWSPSRSDWLAAYLGALLVGVIVGPLDISSKEDFLARVAGITGAKLLVTTQKQYTGLRNPSLPVVNIKSEDRALSILPLSHMFELTIEVALLHSGASIVYARSLAPETLLRLFETQHATCMVLVPQALQLFFYGIEREVRRQKKEQQFERFLGIAAYLPFSWRRLLFSSVHKRFGGHFRFFVSGGAYLPPELAERWENMGFRVMQGYGATECSPVISVTPYNEHVFDSVGKPLPGVEVRTAQDQEIMVHGPNVARGYWKNPEATAAAFKDGWYYTGDLGYLDAKGYLYLKGRKKNLIVLANGLNVYPEDIENVLQANPLVKEAIIAGLMEEDRGPEVHAILLVDDPGKAKAIVQQANKQLASHQQIRGFSVWPEQDFPRTYTLKVKRQDVLNRLQEIRKQAKA